MCINVEKIGIISSHSVLCQPKNLHNFSNLQRKNTLIFEKLIFPAPEVIYCSFDAQHGALETEFQFDSRHISVKYKQLAVRGRNMSTVLCRNWPFWFDLNWTEHNFLFHWLLCINISTKNIQKISLFTTFIRKLVIFPSERLELPEFSQKSNLPSLHFNIRLSIFIQQSQ